MDTNYIFWIGFAVFVLLMLLLDLGVFHKKSHVVKFKEALAWSAVWITLAIIFNFLILFWKGPDRAIEFTTGYLLELSLSVDNLFIFILIFRYFKVPPNLQHKVLFWGIIGALVMRVAFILAGVALISKFHWITYLFSIIIIVSGVKMIFNHEAEIDPASNPIIKLIRKFLPTTKNYYGDKFIVQLKGKLLATPLLYTLVLIETSDLIFAMDSIPAILAITNDSFIVFTSNIFAILGLRSLYFALAGLLTNFKYLHFGLAGILIFIGSKMGISEFYKIPIEIALIVVLLLLLGSIFASLIHTARQKRKGI
jgi:tellurite resistance protein TerC